MAYSVNISKPSGVESITADSIDSAKKVAKENFNTIVSNIIEGQAFNHFEYRTNKNIGSYKIEYTYEGSKDSNKIEISIQEIK